MSDETKTRGAIDDTDWSPPESSESAPTPRDYRLELWQGRYETALDALRANGGSIEPAARSLALSVDDFFEWLWKAHFIEESGRRISKLKS